MDYNYDEYRKYLNRKLVSETEISRDTYREPKRRTRAIYLINKIQKELVNPTFFFYDKCYTQTTLRSFVSIPPRPGIKHFEPTKFPIHSGV